MKLFIGILILIILYFNYEVKEHFQWNQEKIYKKCSEKSPGNILGKVFSKFNIARDNNTDDWDLYIPCGYNNVEKELLKVKIKNKDQKIFGIKGCDSIVSKNKVWELLTRKYGRDIAKTIMPETYILKNELDLFKKDYVKNNMYILKKNIQRKRGLKITNNLEEILNAAKEKYKVVQSYVKDVFLVNNRKVNLRIYLLLVCRNNDVEAYLYNEGKCIYTNKDYDPNDIIDPETNITSLNLDQSIYEYSPFSFVELRHYLNQKNFDGTLLFKRIEKKIKKLFYAVKDSLCNLDTLKNNTSFQLFGLDVIFTNTLRPYILELNKGPAMKHKNDKDFTLKNKLNTDILNLVGLVDIYEKNNFKKIG